MASIVLFDYWRSSASYRVRIALHTIGLPFETVSVDLLAGEQSAPEHLARNPQGLVPVLEIDGLRLTQSTSIIEYLDETRGVGFLPTEPAARARVRALANAIAMETHPVCNPKVVGHVLEIANGDDAMRSAWMKHFIFKGLSAFEALLDNAATGQFCHGNQPGLADLCLVPQVYNARRWAADISTLTRVNEIAARCEHLEAFIRAHPDIARPAG
jgi:maleylacetoacetate isomerase